MKPVDMSPEAIDRRLRDLSDLYDFGKTMKNIKHLGPVNPDAKIDFEELDRLLAIYGDQLRADSRADEERQRNVGVPPSGGLPLEPEAKTA